MPIWVSTGIKAAARHPGKKQSYCYWHRSVPHQAGAWYFELVGLYSLLNCPDYYLYQAEKAGSFGTAVARKNCLSRYCGSHWFADHMRQAPATTQAQALPETISIVDASELSRSYISPYLLFTFPHRHEFYSPKLKNISREHKCLLSVLFRDNSLSLDK